MEHRFGGGSALEGREKDVDGRRMDACHECGLFEEFSRRSGAKTGVTGFHVSANRAPLPVAAVAGKQDQPIGVSNQHAGHQMGIVKMTSIDERHRLYPRRFTAYGRSGSYQERSRRVPLVDLVHSHDGIDEASVRPGPGTEEPTYRATTQSNGEAHYRQGRRTPVSATENCAPLIPRASSRAQNLDGASEYSALKTALCPK